MVSNIGLDSGSLRHSLTIQQNTPTYDAANQPIDHWSDWLIRWGQIQSVQGGDFIQGAQLRNKATHVCTLRYLPTLAPKLHRILFAGRSFNILSVVNQEERNIATIAYCAEDL